MTREELYKKCVEAWGEEAQLDMAIEEAAEFIQAINKFKRGEGPSKVIEEIADLQLMLEQVKYIISQMEGADSNGVDKAVKIWTDIKVYRLKGRLGLDKE